MRLNGDGKINSGANKHGDSGDYQRIGNSTPRFKFGISLDAEYKGFDFRMFLQGVGKRDLWLDGSYFWGATGGGNEWQSTGFVEHWDFWRPESDSWVPIRMPIIPVWRSMEVRIQMCRRVIYRTDYLRLKNI